MDLERTDEHWYAVNRRGARLGYAYGAALIVLGAVMAFLPVTPNGPLLPVLLFPLLVPLLLSVVSATRAALPGGDGWAGVQDELLTLVGFAGVVITASVLLFDYVWND